MMTTTIRTRSAQTSREETCGSSVEREKGLTVEQEWERFDAASQRYLGMSGKVFLDQYNAGEFDDDPDRFEVMHVWLLRPSINNSMP